MQKLKPLYDFYTSILGLCSMTVDEGFVSVTLAGATKPCTIDGKRLLMPYKNRFKEFDPDLHRFFHPMSESLSRGESEVLEKIRTNFMIKANYVTGRIGAGLLHILSTPSEHSKLDIDQAELLEQIKDNFEGSTVKWSENVVLRMTKNKVPNFIDMRLIKLGMYQGKRYPRLGVVYFPLFETINNTEANHGLQVREIKLYKQLLSFMFDMSPQAYCRPSNTDTAPFLYAFIKSAVAVAETLNTLLERYKDWIVSDEKDYEECLFNLDGLDQVENLTGFSQYMRLLPLQMGNDGRIEYDPTRTDGDVGTVAQHTQQPLTPTGQHQVNQQPNQVTNNSVLAGMPNVNIVPSQQMAPPSPWDSIPSMQNNQTPMMGMMQQRNILSERPSWMTPNTAPSFGMQQPQQQNSPWSAFPSVQSPFK